MLYEQEVSACVWWQAGHGAPEHVTQADGGDRESCDPTRANDCISTVRNPLLDIEPPALSKAYSSLSAAQTGATYLSFDPLALVAPAAPDPPSRDSLGGGAIAGIVVGAIGAVLLGLLVWLLWRKQRRLEGRTRSSTGATAAGMEDVHKTHSELPPSGGSGSPAPVSTDHGYHASELPVREYGQGASELPAQHHGHGASELHEEPTAAYIVEAPTYSAR